MSKFLYDLQLTVILAGIWLILFENISLVYIVSGIVVGFTALRISERYFLGCSFYDRYYFNVFKILLYFPTLILEIYIAGFSTLLKIITGKVNTDIVTISTELESDFKKSILANSITLTPGTVTLDVTDQQLRVLWLDVKTKQPALAGQMIKGNLERKL